MSKLTPSDEDDCVDMEATRLPTASTSAEEGLRLPLTLPSTTRTAFPGNATATGTEDGKDISS